MERRCNFDGLRTSAHHEIFSLWVADMQRERARKLQTLPLVMCLSLITAITRGCQASHDGDILLEWTSSLSSDPLKKLQSWQQGTDPCTWQHAACDSTQTWIIRIDLGNSNLSWTLYSGLGDLSKLQYLELYQNNISGQIPNQLGNLANLVNLDLYHNSLSGTIPATLSNCTQLQILRLNNNTLQGSIPVQLTTISKLKTLDLSYNNLSGEVPVNGSFSQFTPVSYAGNPNLCGSAVNKSCPNQAPLSPPVQPSSPAASESKMSKTIIGAIAGGVPAGIILLSAIGLAWWAICRSADNFVDVPDNPEPVVLGQLKCFTLWELRVASDNFHPKNVLGHGGFGKVYKGRLADGSLVAIKRLKDEFTPGGERQFQAEVEMISMAVHRHILRLLGFCVTPGERLLVYPYMPNGSVASRLGELIDDTPPLSSKTRKKIALGTAQGLAYMHDHCDPKIIHRDVKAGNILLDEDFEALIGDFGLAKVMNHKVSQVTTAVRGTIGHIAPEYMSTGRSSEKTDVFGYGIFLLELVTGQRAIDLSRLAMDKDVMLLDWVKRQVKEDQVDMLVDPHLKENYDRRELEELLQIALLCSQSSPKDRPKMSEVVKMLEGEGLEEHWDEWQQVDLIHTSEIPSDAQFPAISNWSLESTAYEHALELSGPR